ncbi:MAG: bifunctional demethylmenaquinone methyltransferase/2-methoxy-6-polyprenyl-1,4-benzoquinol methylase UbiE [Phycisphaerales bacterium]|nr:bifunctional demethylmenaquinone methyltransferase/2-methoxy-6-polyprenyl-1,4-benzoquinol methylase UbiE [Planctomycetota bacterium]
MNPASSDHAAWTQRELAGNPHQNSDKAAKVRSMFSAIAPKYDLNNRLHSFGRDQAWRRFAVRAAGVRPGEKVLDVACGTGDLTQEFARSAAGSVLGVDFTGAMLDVARQKQTRLSPQQSSKIQYAQGDATALNLPDESFDVLSIAFGIRNVSSPDKALAEFRRVLRPGGRLVILEFDRPSWFPMRQLNDFYCGWVMPRTASLIARDRSGAYRYLPKSVGTFFTRQQMKDAITRAGFQQPAATGLTLGICVCYVATR